MIQEMHSTTSRASVCRHSVGVVIPVLRGFFLPPTKEEVYRIRFCPCSFVCLSVRLCARLLKKACVDLDEMLRVDRCRDMDELTNF